MTQEDKELLLKDLCARLLYGVNDKYEGLTDFERTLADICIGWIGEELGWKQYIKDNADVLLKISIEKFKSVQDTLFKQKPDWSEEDECNLQCWIAKANYDIQKGNVGRNEELIDWLKSLKDRVIPQPDMVEALRTEYEKGRADVITEMKSSWSEEDEKTLNEIFSVAARASLRKSTLFGKSYDYIKWQNWLKSLRDRVQPQPKQKWSEEDEKRINRIIIYLESANVVDTDILDDDVDWLKSIKQRMGG